MIFQTLKFQSFNYLKSKCWCATIMTLYLFIIISLYFISLHIYYVKCSRFPHYMNWPRPPNGKPAQAKMLPRRERQPLCSEIKVIEDGTRSIIHWAVVHSPEPKTRYLFQPIEPELSLKHQTWWPPPHDDSTRGLYHSYRWPTPPGASMESSPEIEQDLVADPLGVMLKKKLSTLA